MDDELKRKLVEFWKEKKPWKNILILLAIIIGLVLMGLAYNLENLV